MARTKAMKFIRTFKRTVLLTLLSGLFFTGSILFAFDPFEAMVDFLGQFEKYQADELFLMVPFVLVGLLLDVSDIRHRREEKLRIQQQRLHILKATMTTVHDIVNNFLNNLQIFRVEMEQSKLVDNQQLELFDSLVYDTTMKLRAISNLKDTPIKHMGGGIQGIDVDKALAAQLQEDNTDTEW